jgi:hypothetical protein
MTTKQFDNFADIITFTRASTGTYLDSDGLLKTATTNTPRIEYDINGNRKGLLIEEARTNLFLRSEEFDNAVWNAATNATLTANASEAPDGTTTADRFTATVNIIGERREQAVAVAASTQKVFSVWAKAGTQNTGQARIVAAGSSEHQVLFTPTANWVRYSVLVPATDTATSLICRIYPSTSGGATGDNVLFWGAQLEAGSFPTSYIPTAGSTATRAADMASIPTSAFGYNQKTGTVVCEFDLPYNDVERRIYTLGVEGSVSNRVMDVYRSTGVNPRVVMFNGSTTFAPATGPVPSPSTVGSVYKSGDYALILNGGTIAVNTSATVNTPNILAFGRVTIGSNFACGHIKSIQYYPRRLSNAQIVRLTS